jgi:hypothetical protein
VQATTLPTAAQVFAAAHGRALYPWEEPEGEQPRPWRASALRPLLLPCLSRDTAARPSASALAATVQRVGVSTLALHTTTAA